MFKFHEFVLPAHMEGAIHRYLERGIHPGGFLEAVICHDLFEAVGRADETNMRNLPAFVAFFYNETPAMCHGSLEIMDKWTTHRQGVYAKQEGADNENPE